MRALGQTDLNPVSGVGKLSQIIFAGLSPGAIIPNVVAGAVAEAGAMQVRKTYFTSKDQQVTRTRTRQ